ncbi:MAG: serine/threonine-protein phosphatase [Planctomycetales bacterium]|nr:serine/threonine-protein phosphatase [Planctomycetales bacterium]
MSELKSNSGPAQDPWKSTVKHAVLTDVGMRRAINQDSLSVMLAESKASWEKLGHLFIVADGMGAHAAGELASKLAVDLIPHHYLKLQACAPAESLHKSIAETNAEIFRRGQANIEFRSMGTTCSVLALLPEGAVVAHVGDSRVYQLHGEQLFQLTFDHSLVWEMQAAGEVTDETARSGVIPKNVITRSLGPNPNVQIDLEGPFPVRPGDRFLLCSDGLSGQITDEEIGALLRALPPEEAARLFVDLANLRGGPDNITAIIVEAVDPRLTTDTQGTISLRRNGPRKPFSIALGVVTAVCLLATAILFLMQLLPLALVTFVLGSIALATGLVQVYWTAPSSSGAATRYGNGPYRQYSAKPNQTLFEHLAGTMKSLREASEERNWQIDWPTIDRTFAQAKARAEAQDYLEAVRLQAGLIIELMRQIRQQRGTTSSDSAIDL